MCGSFLFPSLIFILDYYTAKKNFKSSFQGLLPEMVIRIPQVLLSSQDVVSSYTIFVKNNSWFVRLPSLHLDNRTLGTCALNAE